LVCFGARLSKIQSASFHRFHGGDSAYVFGVTGNSPLDYLATLKYVADRIEPGGTVAIYVYAYNDFVSLHRFFERGIFTASSSLNQLLDWGFYFDRWRQATWTYSLFRQGRAVPSPSPPQQQISLRSLKRTDQAIDSRDAPPYVTPKPLNRRHRFAFNFFLGRLNEFVRDRSWRVFILIHPDHLEIHANFARRSSVFVDLDPRRGKALSMCEEFSFHCEDISCYIYECSAAAGKNPYFEHDRHFSAFRTRIVAEHSFENWGWGWANWPTYEEAPQLPNSFPLTGKDKGRGDGFDRFPGTPIPTFPHRGERRSK
jgi:hypothetical protein